MTTRAHKTKRLEVRFDDESFAKLQALSKRFGLPMAEILRELTAQATVTGFASGLQRRVKYQAAMDDGY